MLVQRLSYIARCGALSTNYRQIPYYGANATTRRCQMMKNQLYNTLPGSYTWQTWLWYRRDGTPRRKWKGPIYGELIKVVRFECHL